MHAEELIAIWKAWDEHPGDGALARRLVDAKIAFAGDRYIDLSRHVAVRRQAGASISAAIYTWTPT